MTNIAPSDQDFIDAANAAYSQDPTVAPPGLTPLVWSNQTAYEHLSDGFYAQAYTDGPNDVIISFEGSIINPLDPNFYGVYGINSKLADAKLAIGQSPQALQDAVTFANAVVSAV